MNRAYGALGNLFCVMFCSNLICLLNLFHNLDGSMAHLLPIVTLISVNYAEYLSQSSTGGVGLSLRQLNTSHSSTALLMKDLLFWSLQAAFTAHPVCQCWAAYCHAHVEQNELNKCV